MNGTRQKIQYLLALEPVGRGETPVSGYQGTEPFVAKPTTESPASAKQLMEEMCDRENLGKAWKRVRQNKGSPGVDGMTIEDAKGYLREHWPSIRSQLLEGTYQPQPVKRVEIPKPGGGVGVGVDPVWWTPFHLRRRCHRCRRVTDLMRRNSGDRWLIWSDLDEHQRRYRASSSRP